MQQKKSEKERGDAIIFLALWSKYVYGYFQQSLMKKKNVVFKELTQTQFNLCRRESFDPLIKN
jgi:F420-0:gamma-glutamyl ligase-like protein